MRVVLHAHSDWSYDGHWPLGRIARVFGRLGIGAVMMSEHDTGFDPARFAAYRAACAAASTPRCTLIPGIEYSSPDNDIHILSWGLERFLAEHRPVGETLAAIRAGGGVAVLAHPARREAWRRFDPAWTAQLAGIELWNRKTDGICWGEAARALIARTGLPATIGIDFHRPRQLYPLHHRIDAAPGPGLEATLVAALRSGAHRPVALGAALMRDGAPRARPHRGLEALRRGLVGLRRR